MLKNVLSDKSAPAFDPEAIMNAARLELSKAKTAQQIFDAGVKLPDLVTQVESAMEAFDDAIAAEAVNVDRGRANALRTERQKLSDQRDDAEFLHREIERRHKAKLNEENDAAMVALQRSAEAKRNETFALVLGMAEAMHTVVDGAMRYRELLKKFAADNHRLAEGGRPDLRLPPIWRGLGNGEDFDNMLSFLWDDHRTPGILSRDFFTAVDRLKAAGVRPTVSPLTRH